MKEEKKFYVYKYIDPTNDEVIYIGKGSGNRKQQHWENRNTKNNYDHPFRRRLRKIDDLGEKPKITVVEKDLSEEDAFNLEIELIEKYGRKDLGKGTLWNLTDGGEGSSGWIMAEEQRDSLSDRLRKSWNEADEIECNVCGRKSLQRNGSALQNFISNHYENCGLYPMGREARYKKANISDDKSGISFLLDQCEDMQEFSIRRSFYGYFQGNVTGGHPEDYYIDSGCGTNHRRGVKGSALYDPEFQMLPTISEDLLDYSLRGLDALLDELDKN